jgi:hypothetical protein
LVILVSQGRRETQKAMFRAAVLHILEIVGLTNRVLEVEQHGEIRVYDLPAKQV